MVLLTHHATRYIKVDDDVLVQAAVFISFFGWISRDGKPYESSSTRQSSVSPHETKGHHQKKRQSSKKSKPENALRFVIGMPQDLRNNGFIVIVVATQHTRHYRTNHSKASTPILVAVFRYGCCNQICALEKDQGMGSLSLDVGHTQCSSLDSTKKANSFLPWNFPSYTKM
jgi:hypothetical protein